MSQSTENSVSQTAGLELTREPIPTNGRAYGKWVVLLIAIREAATQGECVVFKADARQYALASAALHGNRQLQPGEKIRMSFDREAGVVRVWMIQKPQS